MEINMPQVSVVMPVYNTAAKFLEEAIDSVINQSFVDWELIIVNDGSTRVETLKKLDEIALFNKKNIIIIHQKNKKISGALNTGIKNMNGDWWAGLASDDIWYPNKLAEQIKFIEIQPESKIVYCDWDYINGESKTIRHFQEPEFKDRMEAGRYIIHDYFGTWTGLMIHKKVFDVVGMFNEAYPTREDYEMNIRILNKFMMYRVPKTLFAYRLHSEQLTNSAYAGSKSADGKKYAEMARAVAIDYFGGSK